MTDSRLPTVAEARKLIDGWYRDALSAVDPEAATADALEMRNGRLGVGGHAMDVSPGGRILPIAIGKAAAAMARGACRAFGARLEPGIILTKDDHGAGAPVGWAVFEAAHPIPDDRGVAASAVIHKSVAGLRKGDVAIVLVSGGGSALFELPRAPLTLDHIKVTTSLLLRAGAPIQDLNAVRSELSDVKGGGFRRMIGEAACVTVILSDVLGNDPAAIASGPTIARKPDPARAMALLDHYGLSDSVPPEVVAALRAAPTEHTLDTGGDRYVIVADNDRFIDEVASRVARSGFSVTIGHRRREGEAQVEAASFVREASTAEETVIIDGGELTVTVRGDGVGGRNTEFALSAAMLLDAAPGMDLVVASLASDGQDGAIDAAGAIVDDATVTRIRQAGIDPGEALEQNDSGRALALAGDLCRPGPTGTNVNDVYMAVRTQRA